MSSAKWQRHSTFLSVRWRTWIGRAAYGVGVLTNVGVRLAVVWEPVKRGYHRRSAGGGTPRKEGRLFSPRHTDARSATRQHADS